MTRAEEKTATPAGGEVATLPPQEALVSRKELTTARCKNCGTALLGRYCVECSQPADVHVPTTGELVHEAMEGLTHADSRLWRTLIPLWFKPGKLTNEFIAGRRVAYVPPFRLYLVLSVIFFLIASFHGLKSDQVLFEDPADAKDGQTTCDNLSSTVPMPTWSARIKHACLAVKADNGANLVHVAISTMPKAMFIFLPLIAFLHMLMYWHPRRRYAEHLLFFLHLHALFFSVAILMTLLAETAVLWPGFDRFGSIISKLLFWALPVYVFIAMRRVFRGGWIRTTLKASVMFVVYFSVLGIGVAGVFAYAALQL